MSAVLDPAVAQIGIFPIPVEAHPHDGWVGRSNDARPTGFHLRMITASAVSADGCARVEFDARPWLEKAEDETIILLSQEWFVGDGPGCRRVLENASIDTQLFVAYVDAHHTGWTLRIDSHRAREWVLARRPCLSEYIEPEMISG